MNTITGLNSEMVWLEIAFNLVFVFDLVWNEQCEKFIRIIFSIYNKRH